MEDILERSHRPRFDPVSTIPRLFTGGPAEAIVAQDAAGTTSATRDGDPVGRVDPGQGYALIVDDPDWWWHDATDLPGALATTGAAHHHGNAMRRAERHLAGDAIGPKRRRRYRRLLARVG